MNSVISSRQFSLLGQYWADHFLLIALCFPPRGPGLGLIWMDWYVSVSWHLAHTERAEQLWFLNEAVKYSMERRGAARCSLPWPALAPLPCCSVCRTPDICISSPSRANFIKSIVFPLERRDLFSAACGRLQGDVDFLPELRKKFSFFPHFPTYFTQGSHLFFYWFNRIIILRKLCFLLFPESFCPIF